MEGRIIEKRSKILDGFLSVHGLAEPKSVEYNPLRGCDMGWCFRNVTRQVSASGGRMEPGWAFFELIDVSIRTIAHAIWITPQGSRMDITPWKFPPERRTLFLPDEIVATKRAYTAGYQTIYSKDAGIRAMMLYEAEIERIFDSVCIGVDSVVDLPESRFKEAAERVGVPWDMARNVAIQRMRRLGP